MDDDFYNDGHMFLDFGSMGELQVNIPIWKWIDVDTEDNDTIRDCIIDNLKLIFDPELPINIYDLGLIYDVTVTDGKVVNLIFSLTSPNCPSAQSLPEVMQMAARVVGVNVILGKLTFDPPWNPNMMSEDGKLIFQMETGIDPETYKGN